MNKLTNENQNKNIDRAHENEENSFCRNPSYMRSRSDEKQPLSEVITDAPSFRDIELAGLTEDDRKDAELKKKKAEMAESSLSCLSWLDLCCRSFSDWSLNFLLCYGCDCGDCCDCLGSCCESSGDCCDCIGACCE